MFSSNACFYFPVGSIPDETKALSLLAPANAVAGNLPGGGLLPTPLPNAAVRFQIAVSYRLSEHRKIKYPVYKIPQDGLQNIIHVKISYVPFLQKKTKPKNHLKAILFLYFLS